MKIKYSQELTMKMLHPNRQGSKVLMRHYRYNRGGNPGSTFYCIRMSTDDLKQKMTKIKLWKKKKKLWEINWAPGKIRKKKEQSEITRSHKIRSGKAQINRIEFTKSSPSLSICSQDNYHKLPQKVFRYSLSTLVAYIQRSFILYFHPFRPSHLRPAMSRTHDRIPFVFH